MSSLREEVQGIVKMTTGVLNDFEVDDLVNDILKAVRDRIPKKKFTMGMAGKDRDKYISDISYNQAIGEMRKELK